MPKIYKPGEHAPAGPYKTANPKGKPKTIHHKPGKPLPPTPKKGQNWEKS